MPITLPPTQAPLDPAVAGSELPRPFQWLGGAVLGGTQALSGSDDPNNALMGVASPLAVAAGEGSPIGSMAAKKIKSIQHPAMQELLWLLGNVKPESEETSLQKVLGSRITPRTPPTPDPISLPKGFVIPGFQQDKGLRFGAGNTWSPTTAKDIRPPLQTATSIDDLQNIAPSIFAPERERPKLLGATNRTTARQAAAENKMSKTGLSVDIIKDIRALGTDAAQAKYPQFNRNALRDIASGNSWNWVK